MKKKLTLEELEKRIEALEQNRIVYVPHYPMPQYPAPTPNIQCTCNYSIGGWCAVHGFNGWKPYVVTC